MGYKCKALTLPAAATAWFNTGQAMAVAVVATEAIEELTTLPASSGDGPKNLRLEKHTHHHYHGGGAAESQSADAMPDRMAYTLEDEKRLFKQGSIYPGKCTHCNKDVYREYDLQKRDYFVCHNTCGRVVIHIQCAELRSKDPQATKSLVCSGQEDSCEGEIELERGDILLRTIQQLWQHGLFHARTIKFRPVRWIAWSFIYLFLLVLAGWLYKIYWFAGMKGGVFYVDTYNNPRLVGAKGMETANLFTYKFVLASEQQDAIKLHKQPYRYIPNIFQSNGMMVDTGHVWFAFSRVYVGWYWIVWRLMICYSFYALRWLYRRFGTRLTARVREGLSSMARVHQQRGKRGRGGRR